jgi:REP element-mobilizing transposase RayT
MPRPLRIEYPDAWYHILSRARQGQEAFLAQEDHNSFIDLLIDTSEMFNMKVAAYCLMNSHYHLLIQTPDANLSRCMRHINGVYTQRYNARNACDGNLFRGRYKCILIDAESYLLEIVRYIHRNPLRADIVDKLSDYPWSSHKAYISKAKKWEWLNKNNILGMFSRDKSLQTRAYKRFVSAEEPEEIIHHYSKKNIPSILGREKFIKGVKDRFSKKKRKKEIPKSKKLYPKVTDIKKAVCKHYKIMNSELLKSRRGIENEARDLAIYMLRFLRGERLTIIAQEFNLNNYSSVSTAIKRTKMKLANHRFKKQYEQILNSLKKVS